MSNADRYVSTGDLPGVTAVAEVVQTAYERFRGIRDGAVSDVYPALSRVDPDSFGICGDDDRGPVRDLW